jgi:hypothetical protein
MSAAFNRDIVKLDTPIATSNKGLPKLRASPCIKPEWGPVVSASTVRFKIGA